MMPSARSDGIWGWIGRLRSGPPDRVFEACDMRAGGDVTVDAALVTNCMSNGGNAVSTLSEYHALREAGLSVVIVHCSIRRSPWKRRWINEMYRPFAGDIVPAHLIRSLTCRWAIVRAPRAIMSDSFAALAPRMRPQRAILVVNNASLNENGRAGYDWPSLHARVAGLGWPQAELCPTGALVRAESDRFVAEAGARDVMSARDWPPSFDETDYRFAPRQRLTGPIVIGRHARDHPAKWPEDPGQLLAAYPEGDPDIRVRILGGAETVEEMLGRTPAGWDVLPFGTGGVADYLASLDVFVNFPSPERHEAFGRTIVEAALSGLPVILPPRFEATFGELAFYCAPAQARALVARLAADDAGRLAHVAASRDLAARLYGRAGLLERMESGEGVPHPRLGDERSAWRAAVLSGL